MSGAALLSRLALRPGLRSAVRPLSASLSACTTPQLQAVTSLATKRTRWEGPEKWRGVRSISTGSAVRSEASGVGGGKLRIAIIGQSMFGKDVSVCVCVCVCVCTADTISMLPTTTLVGW